MVVLLVVQVPVMGMPPADAVSCTVAGWPCTTMFGPPIAVMVPPVADDVPPSLHDPETPPSGMAKPPLLPPVPLLPPLLPPLPPLLLLEKPPPWVEPQAATTMASASVKDRRMAEPLRASGCERYLLETPMKQVITTSSYRSNR